MSPSEARVVAAFKSLRLVLDRELPVTPNDRYKPIATLNKAEQIARAAFKPTAIAPVFEGQLTIGEPS